MLLLKKSNKKTLKHFFYFFNITQIKFQIIKPDIKFFFFSLEYNKKFTLNVKTFTCFSTIKNQILTISLKTNPLWNFIKKNISNLNYKFVNKYIIYTTFLNYIKLVMFTKINTYFYKLINLFTNKYIYIASKGNYILNLQYKIIKNILIFILPSKKKLITGKWILGYIGKNIFYRINKYIASKKNKKLRIKSIIVRGVAKNPVDHHNGGRSNRKPLFLNKYNNIAKFNK